MLVRKERAAKLLANLRFKDINKYDMLTKFMTLGLLSIGLQSPALRLYRRLYLTGRGTGTRVQMTGEGQCSKRFTQQVHYGLEFVCNYRERTAKARRSKYALRHMLVKV